MDKLYDVKMIEKAVNDIFRINEALRTRVYVENGEPYQYVSDYMEKAIEVLNNNPKFNLEQAVSYLNMANAVEAQKGLENACEEIDALLDKAEKVLDENYSETDGNYAFVCEKCAPTFGYYGRFLYENELKERARVIYERT